MQEMKILFDESRDLYRVIEKVITFGVDNKDRLESEISEYVVTSHIERAFEDLLTKMQLAMDLGDSNDIGVWVSGFYGSGKSSFTKYLGLALDQSTFVDDQSFLKHLQDRLKKTTTKTLLSKVAKSYPAAVVFLDLASDMLAGRSGEAITEVLFFKVLEYAGFSRNRKVAALERRLQKDGRYDEFKETIRADQGIEWESIQNDLLIVDDLIPEIAHNMYPNLFKTSSSFSSETGDNVRFAKDQAQEMLDIVRDHSGKEHILFIIDEVGQYVASNTSLILNLDGLAKNLKALGGGKAWIMATAQQTLTEDDPRAAINSPELFKLNDRFPIKIDLLASDIKEICYERLLKKAESGKATLTDLFEAKGQELRQNTKLENAPYYSADFDAKQFVNLYPFLPSHFEILLHLLGALAKSTGGIGLRSAIKVIQDILIEESEDQGPLAQQPVGSLATLVTLFDLLSKDIERAAHSIYSAYAKILIQFPGSEIHSGIGKTVAILQILKNIPVTPHNVAALMHPSVDSPSNSKAIEEAIEELIQEPKVPFDLQEGNLGFLSERLNDLRQIRAGIAPRSVDLDRIFNSALESLFAPLPSCKIFSSLSVYAGIKSRSGEMVSNLAGHQHPIQMVVEFVTSDDFDRKQAELIDGSRGNSAKNNIYLLGRSSDQFDSTVSEIYRGQEIASRFKNDPDGDVRNYCQDQNDRADDLITTLQSKLRKSLLEGVFVFRADKTAVDTVGSQLPDACRKYLGAKVASQVFDKYDLAPVRAETGVAESFLKADKISSITQKIDPLDLVKQVSGNYEIDLKNPALESIGHHLAARGKIDGKQLASKFSADPYGWSTDTLRYLIAAMLRAGKLSLKIGGNEFTTVGEHAIEGLRNNNSFKKVIVGLRDNPPDNERLALAAKRLTELTGAQVIPLEEDISKAALKYFVSIQSKYGSLTQQLQDLALPGEDELRSTCGLIGSSTQNDCSDAVDQIGLADSEIYSGLLWAGKTQQAFDQGLGETLKELKTVIEQIESLPDSGVPGQLQTDTADEISHAKSRLTSNEFYDHGPDFASGLTSLSSAIGMAVVDLRGEQEQKIINHKETLQYLPEWKELTKEEQSETLGKLEAKLISVESNIDGLTKLLNNDYSLANDVYEIKIEVEKLGKKRVASRIEQQKKKNEKEGKNKLEDSISVKKRIHSYEDFKAIRDSLQAVELKSKGYTEFEIEVRVEDDQ